MCYSGRWWLDFFSFSVCVCVGMFCFFVESLMFRPLSFVTVISPFNRLVPPARFQRFTLGRRCHYSPMKNRTLQWPFPSWRVCGTALLGSTYFSFKPASPFFSAILVDDLARKGGKNGTRSNRIQREKKIGIGVALKKKRLPRFHKIRSLLFFGIPLLSVGSHRWDESLVAHRARNWAQSWNGGHDVFQRWRWQIFCVAGRGTRTSLWSKGEEKTTTTKIDKKIPKFRRSKKKKTEESGREIERQRKNGEIFFGV